MFMRGVGSYFPRITALCSPSWSLSGRGVRVKQPSGAAGATTAGTRIYRRRHYCTANATALFRCSSYGHHTKTSTH